jgi:aryl-alcohol dehydrogenase-like predicted oxidoreductase
MRRRTFLQLSAAALAEAPMPMARLGKTGLKVSRFVLGGYHMAVGGDEVAVRIIHRAMELGVNFFDCAWLYHDGRSDSVYGKALAEGRRQKVLVMSKAHDRTRGGAMKQLEDTLGRMKTDYLDLWQCHQVTEQKEVDQILGPNGALEAFVQAKKQGKVRHIGFTGHADPAVHQRLLDSFDGWETVQHPVNLIDPHYLSFIESVLPNIRKKGLGLLAMKSNGMGSIGKASIAPIAECLRFAWSHDVDVVVSGVETVEQLEQNVAVLKTLKPMSKQEIAAVLERTRKGPHGVGVERYKRKPGTAVHPAHRDGERA